MLDGSATATSEAGAVSADDAAADDAPLRILFITRKWPPAVGGMETYCHEISQEYRWLGHVVETIALPGRSDGSVPSSLSLLRFGISSALRLLLRRGDWDAIHGGDLSIWPLVWLASLGARGEPRLVLSAHGTDVSYAQRRGAFPWLYCVYLRMATRLVPPYRLTVVSNSQATDVRVRKLGFTHTEIVPLGCRVETPTVTQEDPSTLLFAGRLVQRKGLSWFVREVLPDLPESLTLSVCGPIIDHTERAALDHPRVTYLGSIAQDELWTRMATALAVVIPNVPEGGNSFEGFGLVAAEAAAAGGIVVASRLDGYTDSVVDGVTGTLVPPCNADAWRVAIERIAAETPEARRQRRDTAREAARDRFSWQRVARETARIAAPHDGPPAIPPVESDAHRPRVSIVTAAFNAADALSKTLTSVAGQSFRDVEHVVIDGGSTDGTTDVLAAAGPDVRWVSEPDCGIADAMNKGVTMARGEWIIVLHAGDTFVDSRSLGSAVPHLSGGTDVLTCGIRYGGEERETIQFIPHPERRLWLKTILHQGAVCRRSLFEKIGGFDGSFRIAMDYDFFLRARNAEARFSTANLTLARMDDSGISSQRDWSSLRARFAEERRVQSRHARGVGERAFYAVYWPPYLAYRRFRSLLSSG